MLLLSVGVEVLGYRVEEFRGRGEIPKRVIDMRVTQVGREGGHALLHIRPCALPVQEGPHREAVAKVMQAGARARGRIAQADLA